MNRATWLAAAALVAVIAYSIVATLRWTDVRTSSIPERHRLRFCRDFGNVIGEHRRDVRAQFHFDISRAMPYIAYLGRENQIIVNALRLCLPTIKIGELDPGDWVFGKMDDAWFQESALGDYEAALEVLELMIKRQ